MFNSRLVLFGRRRRAQGRIGGRRIDGLIGGSGLENRGLVHVQNSHNIRPGRAPFSKTACSAVRFGLSTVRTSRGRLGPRQPPRPGTSNRTGRLDKPMRSGLGGWGRRIGRRLGRLGGLLGFDLRGDVADPLLNLANREARLAAELIGAANG